MVSEEKENQSERSLRSVSPQLYSLLVTELEKVHIHPYDIQANATEKETGYQLLIRFGNDFSHKESVFFSFESIENEDNNVTEFIKNIGETCKQAMIADYYKMIKM
ncbi:hypothetical protein [Virgibacillus sp. DJP39]|uniref:hypothetical protein n=1 Tax=Virgibacillus sp. DJP39 TaxID=3409790 RepID=UPI003BB7F5AD